MRKFYYLKPNIQYAFTIFFALLTAIEIALFALALFLIDHVTVLNAYDIQLYIRFSLVFFLILLFSGINFWYGIRLSHRIVGPMIQINRVLESALKNEFRSRIQLRSTDYLHEVADALNLLLEKLDRQNPKNEAGQSENK